MIMKVCPKKSSSQSQKKSSSSTFLLFLLKRFKHVSEQGKISSRKTAKFLLWISPAAFYYRTEWPGKQIEPREGFLIQFDKAMALWSKISRATFHIISETCQNLHLIIVHARCGIPQSSRNPAPYLLNCCKNILIHKKIILQRY